MDGSRNLVLREVSKTDGLDVYDMLQEIGPGENGFQNGAFGMQRNDFPGYLRRCVSMAAGEGLEPGYVPMTTYLLLDGGYPVGMSKLRHRLTEKLRRHGGHIGYCIRPTERGKGYGTSILGLTIEKAAAFGITRLLITCNEGNTPSRKVIQANGGILERIEYDECFYWIERSILDS